MTRVGDRLACAVMLGVLATGGVPAAAQTGSDGAGWRSYAGDVGSTKYSPLDQIDADNVDRLHIAWRLKSLDYGAAAKYRGIIGSPILETTPLAAGGRLLVNSGSGLAAALDPGSGEILWVYDPYADGATRDPSSYAFIARGGALWEKGEGARFLFVSNGSLVSVDAASGRPDPAFGSAGKVDLRQGVEPPQRGFIWSSPPLVCGDTVVVGNSTRDNSMRRKAPPGTIRGYDAASGELLWVFYIIPRRGEPGYETWEEGSANYTGSANVWSWMSCDPQLGMVYAPTTTPNNDWYGGHRPGAGLYAESILALEARTGERVWHFQAVHHGLWDYDFPAAPLLADITVGGRAIKALVQVSKQAFLYVFDRVTGEPVWPIVELPVPPSRIPGERAWPTQPHPTWPKPVDLQGLSVDDLVDFTPELRIAAMQRIEKYRLGPLFLPPELLDGDAFRGAIQSPSAIGATAWNGAAFDPETQVLYVPSITALLVVDLRKPDPSRSDFDYTHEIARGGGEHVQFEGGLPITKPPYGRLTAVDLKTGEHLWAVANGDGPRDHPLLAGLELPPLGQTGRASPLVTKTLVFLGEGSPAMIGVPEGGGGPMFRAFDKTTGEELWQIELPAGVTSAPMTYLHDGRQYVLVAVGDRSHEAEFIALTLAGE